MRRLVRLAAVAGCALVATTGASAATPVRVTPTGTHPDVAIAPDNVPVVVFNRGIDVYTCRMPAGPASCAGALMPNAPASTGTGDFDRPAWIRRGTGTVANNLYVLAVRKASTNVDDDIVVWTSTDNGVTWGTPVLLTTPTIMTEMLEPVLIVSSTVNVLTGGSTGSNFNSIYRTIPQAVSQTTAGAPVNRTDAGFDAQFGRDTTAGTFPVYALTAGGELVRWPFGGLLSFFNGSWSTTGQTLKASGVSYLDAAGPFLFASNTAGTMSMWSPSGTSMSENVFDTIGASLDDFDAAVSPTSGQGAVVYKASERFRYYVPSAGVADLGSLAGVSFAKPQLALTGDTTGFVVWEDAGGVMMSDLTQVPPPPPSSGGNPPPVVPLPVPPKPYVGPTKTVTTQDTLAKYQLRYVPSKCVKPNTKFTVKVTWIRKSVRPNRFLRVNRVDFWVGKVRVKTDKVAPFQRTYVIPTNPVPGSKYTVGALAYAKVSSGRSYKRWIRATITICR